MVYPLVHRNTVVAFKVEGTAGTAETGLDADDAKFLTFDAMIEPTIQVAERRPDSGTGGQLPGTPGQYLGRFSCTMELRGKGSSGVPAWAAMLPCFGLAARTGQAYHLSNATADKATATVQVYNDGIRRQLHGAMGSRLRITGKPGERVMIEMEMIGIYTKASDQAILAPTHETTLPPRFASNAITWGSEAPLVSEFSLDLNLETTMRADSSNVAGAIHAFITGFRPVVTMDPETQLVAADDLDGAFMAGDTRTLSIPIGATANNIITLAAPRTQVESKPPQNREGISVEQVTLRCCDAATDPFAALTLTFS